MPDLTPEQDRLNSARDRAHLAAKELALNLGGIVETHNQGGQPDAVTMRAIELDYATLSAYFALLRKES